MAGFVDIHSHILWGVDDGAQDLQISLEMLRIAAAARRSTNWVRYASLLGFVKPGNVVHQLFSTFVKKDVGASRLLTWRTPT